MAASQPGWRNLAVVIAVAFVLRAWQPGQMQIEHFDEGVYASNLLTGHLGNAYPDQHLYSPPLFPSLLEWTVILGGGNPQAPLWLNVILGTALAAAVYQVAKEWFDVSTAMTAGLLVATSDFAIWFSRAALTDTPLCLWLVLGLLFGSKAIRGGNWIWLLLSALCGALAWWTKYNGWLPGAILVAGTCGWWLFERRGIQDLRGPVFRAALIATGMFLCWLPLPSMLAPHGGYAAVASNHKGYFVGLSGWWNSFQAQLAVAAHLAGPVTLGGIATAWAVLTWNRKDDQTATSKTVDSIPQWILAAWIISLLVAIPLYRPYPRLQLPLQIGACLLVAKWLTLLSRIKLSHWSRPCWGLAVFAGIPLFGVQFTAWESRTGLQRAAESVRQSVNQELANLPASQVPEYDCLLYVLAEPGLFYHLASHAGEDIRDFVQPAGNLGMLDSAQLDKRLPNFLITGPHAHRDHPELLQDNPGLPGLQRLASWPYTPSELVLLDDVPPSQLTSHREQLVQLWLISP